MQLEEAKSVQVSWMTKDAQIRLTRTITTKVNEKKTIVKLFVHHLRPLIRKQCVL